MKSSLGEGQSLGRCDIQGYDFVTNSQPHNQCLAESREEQWKAITGEIPGRDGTGEILQKGAKTAFLGFKNLNFPFGLKNKGL